MTSTERKTQVLRNVDGLRHCTTGPAVVFASGECQWWFNGKWYTFENWLIATNCGESQKSYYRLKYPKTQSRGRPGLAGWDWI